MLTNNKNFVILACLLSIFVRVYNITSYRKCAAEGRIECFDLTGCKDDSAKVCQMDAGNVLNLTVDFLVCRNVSSAQLKVTISDMIGISEDFQLENIDLCENFGFNCPLIEEQVYEFQHRINISAEPLLPLGGAITFEGIDEDNRTIFCAEIDGRLLINYDKYGK